MTQDTINTNFSSLMWVEKYRPKRIEQIVNQKDVIISLKNLIKKPNELPHLLFTGPAGVGKTTTAICLSMELLGEEWKRDTLELNASDERGIKMVRERVKEFAAVIKLPSGNNKNEKPYRIIILDEADEMTSEAQTALRRIIEDSSKTTRFIIICNYLSQIIEPIQSRCAIFHFTRLDEEDVLEYLKIICKQENIDFQEEALSKIYRYTEGDLRHTINILQTASGYGQISIKNVTSAMGLSGKTKVGEIIKLALAGKFNDARTKLLELLYVYGLSDTDFFKYAYQEIKHMDIKNIDEIMSIMAEYDYRLSVGAHSEIQLTAFLAQLCKIGSSSKVKR
ncbi:MAG TPA: replication factor C small subunit [Nitrososphaeraceae archaeon]|nr:replication factor C small subunit [Nitrososphaeraceae archaeon]